MVDISSLNYKQLIELEKRIQKEKEKKIKEHLTKNDLENSEKMKEIIDILYPKFKSPIYGYNNRKFKSYEDDIEFVEYLNSKSDEEKERIIRKWEYPQVLNDIGGRLTKSMTYLCDIAFENYRDHVPTMQTGPNRGKAKSDIHVIAMLKEIPWKKADKYKEMYDELCSVIIKYLNNETEDGIGKR